MLTLAEQIIAALPERIKRAEGDSPSSSSPPPPAPPLSSLEDALMEQMVSLLLPYHIVAITIKRLILFDIIFHDVDGDKFILSRDDDDDDDDGNSYSRSILENCSTRIASAVEERHRSRMLTQMLVHRVHPAAASRRTRRPHRPRRPTSANSCSCSCSLTEVTAITASIIRPVGIGSSVTA